ncbi:MAG: CinA family protein [Hyphomicrobiaceae bacterium]|nr:CinA family protein [Hyphomicrobiaceae bacterium]MCC0023443.1 CinA family protein [Hyphomicrobiaceae bacterium]
MFDDETLVAAARLIDRLNEKSWWMVTAESCTGGLVAGALTSIAGSSSVVHGGFVTYANEAKVEMLGLREATLASEGAVSEATAREMAWGAFRTANVDLAVAITGIAGPGGGSAEKPVGLVHFAVATERVTQHERHEFGDIGRQEVRAASVKVALALALKAIDAKPRQPFL